MKKNQKTERFILAIESSCDETSVAVIKNGHIICSNIIASQIESHKRFGGVVPEVASRHHVEEITYCMEAALEKAAIEPNDLSAVAVTEGPGLVGALLIGISAAKAFAWANQLPLIAVNHMVGHIYSVRFQSEILFPSLALLVSGGHTELVYLPKKGEYQIIGETRDDAAGEAYDKVGRVMGLSYPSGKEIDEMAHLGADSYHFPRAMLKENNYDFSFSGLKSAFINTVHNGKQKGVVLNQHDLATSFQKSVIEVLVAKTMRACKEFPIKQLIVAGGVAANKGLKEELTNRLQAEKIEIQLLVPPVSLCGDNAAMIGAAAFVQLENNDFSDLKLNAVPNLTFEKKPSF